MPGPIAVKLRVLREERGLTHKEAAKLANVSHWSLIYLESGKRPLLGSWVVQATLQVMLLLISKSIT